MLLDKPDEGYMKEIDEIIYDIYNISEYEIPMIEGFGPEVSLLRSTIMVKGLDKAELSDDNNLNTVIEVINNAIIESENTPTTFDKIYNVLQSSPYGIRKGIIPVYIAFVMRKKQNVIVISHKNKEISLSGDILSQIENSPADYSFYTEKGTKEKDDYIDSVIALFGTENDEIVGNKCAFAVEVLQKWFRGLSKFARDHMKIYKSSEITNIEKKVLSFKRQLLQYDVNPHSFMFNDIPDYFECEDNYTEIISKLKVFAESYNHFIWNIKTYLIEKVSGAFKSTINGSLCSIMNDWYESLPNETKNHVFSSDINTFIHFIRENTSFDDMDVISKLAKSITMLAIEDWNDKTVADFVFDIEKYINTINHFELEEVPIEDKRYIGLSIDYAGKSYEKNITKAEISGIAETALNNIESELEDYGDAISAQERVTLLLKLLRKEIEKL